MRVRKQGINKKVAIIGAGPAGCMSAFYASKSADVTLFDFKEPLTTLLYTGGGRCNLAHAEYDFKELAKNYPRGEKFLYSVFTQFSTYDTIAFFEQIGVKTYTQDDSRIFPVSNSASKVRSSMLSALSECSFVKEKVINISLTRHAEQIPHQVRDNKNDESFLIKTAKNNYSFDSVIIAVGGHAGFELAKGLGHKIIEPRPALTGLVGYAAVNSMSDNDLQSRLGLPTQQQKSANSLNSPQEQSFKAIQGVSLKNIEAHFYYTPHPKPSPSRGEGVEQNPHPKPPLSNDTKSFVRQSPSRGEGVSQGDLIFTHEGISGPLAYTISSICAREDYNKKNPLIIKLNLLSNYGTDEILRVARDDVNGGSFAFQSLLNSNPKKDIKNLISDFVPKSLAEFIIHNVMLNSVQHRKSDRPCGPETSSGRRNTKQLIDKKCCDINGVERDKIYKSLTEFEIRIISPSKEGEVVTSGGVSLDEVNAKTMESKLVEGLYFCGEVLDIDGFCGGFNLQNCWSTGSIAGESI